MYLDAADTPDDDDDAMTEDEKLVWANVSNNKYRVLVSLLW